MYNFFNTENANAMECLTVGKCSVDPGTIALSEAFIYETRQLAYYILKIKELGYENRLILNTIIDTLSSVNFGFNYIRKDVESVLNDLLDKRKEVVEYYKNICMRKNLDCQLLQSIHPSDEDISLVKAIMTGEKQAINKNTQLSRCKKNLYEIIILMAKSASSTLMKLGDYSIEADKEKYEILEFINNLNFINFREEKLVRKIIHFAKTAYDLNLKLYAAYEENYGNLRVKKVKFDRHQGKCILVSGDNFHDLDLLLKATDGKDINVYTHDKMIWTFAYPHFQKYPHLKGHYQNELNSFQIDFSKFPGPILLTRDYSNKVDNVYRGRMYSTDFISGKGISKIKDYNFDPIIEGAHNSKGFAEDKEKFKLNIGYNFKTIENKIDEITEKIENGEYKNIFVVGLVNHGHNSQDFFERFFEKIENDEFIISLAYDKKGDNIYHIDSYFDFSLIYKIIERIKSKDSTKNLKIKALITQCTNDSVTNIITLKQLGIDDLYISCCSVNTLNPSVMECLKEKFNVRHISENPDIEIVL